MGLLSGFQKTRSFGGRAFRLVAKGTARKPAIFGLKRPAVKLAKVIRSGGDRARVVKKKRPGKGTLYGVYGNRGRGKGDR